MRKLATRKLGAMLCATWFFGLGCESDTQGADPAPRASASATEASKPVKVKSLPAQHHLPPGCDLVVTVDVQKLFTNARLGPQLVTALVPPKDPKLRQQVMNSPEQSAFLGFLEASTIDPRKDLKTVALCQLGAEDGEESRFLAIIAGQFPSRLPELMQERAPSGKAYSLEPLGAQKALYKEGKWLAQGAGNVVLFGNDKEIVSSVLKPSDAHEQYALPQGEDLAVVVNQKALATVEGPDGDVLVSLVRHGRRLELAADLNAGKLKGVMDLPDAATAQKLNAAIDDLRKRMVAQSKVVPPNVRQMMQPTIDVLEAAQFTPRGSRLELALQLPPGLLENALQQLVMMQMGAAPMPGVAGPGMAGPGMGMPGAMMGGPAGAPRAVLRQPAARKRVARGSKSQAPSAQGTIRPMPPMPQLPSFQLTPPSALRGGGTSTVPALKPSPPPAMSAAPGKPGEG